MCKQLPRGEEIAPPVDAVHPVATVVVGDAIDGFCRNEISYLPAWQALCKLRFGSRHGVHVSWSRCSELAARHPGARDRHPEHHLTHATFESHLADVVAREGLARPNTLSTTLLVGRPVAPSLGLRPFNNRQ